MLAQLQLYRIIHVNIPLLIIVIIITTITIHILIIIITCLEGLHLVVLLGLDEGLLLVLRDEEELDGAADVPRLILCVFGPDGIALRGALEAGGP